MGEEKIKIIGGKSKSPHHTVKPPVEDENRTAPYLKYDEDSTDRLLFELPEGGWTSYNLAIGMYLRNRGFIAKKPLVNSDCLSFNLPSDRSAGKIAGMLNLNPYHPQKNQYRGIWKREYDLFQCRSKGTSRNV